MAMQLKEMPFQATRKSLTSISIKDDEKIVWVVGENWFPQLKQQIEQYRALPRSKSKAHRNFADQLLIQIQEYANIIGRPNPNADPELTKAIASAASPVLAKILNLLSSKTGLSEKGFNRKPSWLYKFCEVASTQYSFYKYAEAVRQESDNKNRAVIAELTKQAKRLESEIVELQTRNTAVRQEIKKLDEQRRAEEKMEFEARQALHKQLDQTKGVLTATEQELGKGQATIRELDAQKQEEKAKSDEQIAARQRDLKSLQDALENTRQSLSGASTTATELKRQNEQLGTIRRNHDQAMEKLAVVTTENQGLIAENQALRKELQDTKKELSTLQKCYDGLKGWVDNLFGNSLGSLISSFFERESSPPKLTEDHEKYIRRIASTQATDITPEFKKSMENVANSFEEDKTVHGQASLLASSIASVMTDPKQMKALAGSASERMQAAAGSATEKMKSFIPGFVAGSPNK